MSTRKTKVRVPCWLWCPWDDCCAVEQSWECSQGTSLAHGSCGPALNVIFLGKNPRPNSVAGGLVVWRKKKSFTANSSAADELWFLISQLPWGIFGDRQRSLCLNKGHTEKIAALDGCDRGEMLSELLFFQIFFNLETDTEFILVKR